jgi:uncharacterized membrane protein
MERTQIVYDKLTKLREGYNIFYVVRHSKRAIKLHILQLITRYVQFSYLTCLLRTLPSLRQLITRPEESYGLWCVVACDLETS